MNLTPVLRGEQTLQEDRMLIINYSRMPNFVNYPSPFSQSLIKRNQA